ncbi:unnamed protein product, partial [Tetraodon nigroviridis]
LSTGTWVTFGGQISDEVGHRSPFALTFDFAVTGVEQSRQFSWKLPVAEQLMTIAYESGVNLFDTAEVYSGGKAEIILGNIIKKKCWRRSSLVITTKLYWGGK